MPPTVRLTATVPAAKLSPVCATSIVTVSALVAFPEVRLIWVANRPGAGISGAPTAVTMIWLKFGFAQFLLRVPVPPSVALHAAMTPPLALTVSARLACAGGARASPAAATASAGHRAVVTGGSSCGHLIEGGSWVF